MLSFLLLFVSQKINAQQFPVSLEQKLQVPVYDIANKAIATPWVGGLNSCQFGSIDLDMDGKKDLVIFDRHGYKILPFLNKGGVGEIKYEYAPQYASAFPKMEHWFQLVDYDGDGKEDIFTYRYPSGIKVYRNTSTTKLSFDTQSSTVLKSLYGTVTSQIPATNVVYPAIADLDGDGDLDILVFSVLGSYVEMHRNVSMEKYGNASTLEFERYSDCWGRFAISAESNQIILNQCSKSEEVKTKSEPLLLKDQKASSAESKHNGSTFLAFDVNNDGVKDILLGDVDYPDIALLVNGGTLQAANIIARDSTYPKGANPIHLMEFPVCALIDVNNDGLKDLLVSSFDPNIQKSANQSSVWLYLNTGTAAVPEFTLSTKNFLQSDMIDLGSGAYPVLVDLDGDGLTDLLVGNWGNWNGCSRDQWGTLNCEFIASIAYFKNIGTRTSPSFKLITNDLAGLSSLKVKSLIPTVGDVDGDGKLEIVVGKEDGKLLLLKNRAANGSTPDFYLNNDSFGGISVPSDCAPQLFDADKDGLLDLFCGKADGKIRWFKNTGTINVPQFTQVTDSVGHVNVSDQQLYLGNAVPNFFRDAQGNTRLYCGSGLGTIHSYSSIDGNWNGTFQEIDSPFANIQLGMRTAVAMADLDNDGILDMVAGNFSGGLSYYKGSTKADGIPISPSSKGLFVYPNPVKDQLTIRYDDFAQQKENTLWAQICDLMGRVLINVPIKETISTLSTQSISPGCYLLRVVSANKGMLKVVKIIKAK